MVNLKVKRLTETAQIPTKAHTTDACFDLYADGNYTINPGEAAIIKTGISTEIPEGYCALVYPRSGMGIKKHLRLSNGTGVIDADYRGEWMISLHNDGKETQIITTGDRIAQFGVFSVLETCVTEMDTLSNTERGEGGLGSSGK